MENIRTFHPEDVEESMRLSSFSFQYTLTDQERADKKAQFQIEQWYAYTVNEQLAAQLRIIPLEIWLQGSTWPMGGIASIATWPEYRRQGCVRKLLIHALKLMKEQKQTVSMLHPFSFSFYRKFGWSSFIDYQLWTMGMEQVPHFAENQKASGTYERFADWTASDKAKQLLDQAYQRYAQQFSGALSRDKAWWEGSVTRRKRGTAVVYHDIHGQPSGYLLYVVKDEKLTVHEWVSCSDEAERALWTWIRQHDSMAKHVQLTVPAKTDMLYHFNEPLFQRQHVSYFMGRIVDVQQFFKRYRFSEQPKGYELTVDLEDAYAEWNKGVWKLRIAADGTVLQAERDEAASSQAVRCQISELSAALLGALRPIELWRKGGFICSEESAQLWEKAVPRQTPHFPDYF